MSSLRPVRSSGFREVMGRFVSGVTVVTTMEDGVHFGCTISSFCSLSEDPPLVLVCIGRQRRMHDKLVAAPGFVVNVLRRDQAHVARRFAGPSGDRFDGAAVSYGRHGMILLGNAIASVECDLHDVLDGGDHAIVLGRVAAATVREGEPLVYGDGRLGDGGPVPPQARVARTAPLVLDDVAN